MPMNPEDKSKTAFTTPMVLYRFTRMPFGLHGVAATFQRLVDRALQGCSAFAQAYIDDIMVGSPDWPTHLQHLWAVFDTLETAGLRANPKKSRIGFKEVKYLGFLV